MQNFLITTPNTPDKESLPADSRFGIDRLCFYFNLRMEHSHTFHGDWERKTSGKSGETEVERFVLKHPFGHQLANVFVTPEYGRCTVTFDAPKALAKTNQNPLPPDALSPLIRRLISQLQGDILPSFAEVTDEGEITWASDWESQVGITSLEIARDFLIPRDKSAELQAALNVVAARRNYTASNFKSKDNGYTISQSTKGSGRDSFYNKDAELVKDQPFVYEDSALVRYRFESQLKRPRLKRFGLNTLAGIDVNACWSASCERFTEAGWNVTISSRESLLSKLETLDYKAKEKILGFNTISCLGLTSNMTAALRRERTKLARRMGLILGTEVREHPSGSSVLSLNSGTLLEVSED